MKSALSGGRFFYLLDNDTQILSGLNWLSERRGRR